MKRIYLSLLAGLLAAPLAGQPADPHAEYDSGATPSAATSDDPHAAHVMPAPAPDDLHAGHVMPAAPLAESAEPMAGHDMSAMEESTSAIPAGPPPPEAFNGPDHAADTVFPSSVMAAAREQVRDDHGDFRTAQFLTDQLESHIREGKDAWLWDAQGWYGGDINKLWFKTEGEGNFDDLEQAEVQALWSRAIAPWWDFQAGVRHDFQPDPARTFLVAGVQGLMPYQFEIDAAAFFSDEGDLSARVEAEYDQRITQRLILQPRFEVDLALDDVPEQRISSGVTTAELGLRLRYEFAREFAPYIGLEYGQSFGHTADAARAAGEKVAGWSLLLGVRTWF